MTKLVVLASGRGTDFQAILDHAKLEVLKNVELSGLICNHANAQVIQRARSSMIRVHEIEGITGKQFDSKEDRERARVEFDRKCFKIVKEETIGLIVLAGFDQILSKEFVDACRFRILNIHPAYDLKRFGGKNMIGSKVHEAVLNSGVSYSGCTIHFVTSDIDLGPPVLKKKVPVMKTDTPETLEKRILAEEHLAYPEAIQLIADDRVRIDADGQRCFVDRFSNNWDIDWHNRQEKYIELRKELEGQAE